MFNVGYNSGSGVGTPYTLSDSWSIFNYGDAAGQSATIVNSSAEIFNYGYQSGLGMSINNAQNIYAYGYQALYQAALTNSSQIYAFGNSAGASLAGDGYSDIYLFGTAQPTRKTNEFVFGSANDLYTFPGTIGGFKASSSTYPGTKEYFDLSSYLSDIPTGNRYGLRSTFYQRTNSNYRQGAIIGEVLVDTGYTNDFSELLGVYSYARHDGSGIVSNLVSQWDVMRLGGSGDVLLSVGSDISMLSELASSGNLGTGYGIRIADYQTLGAGLITNWYGIYMNIASATSVNPAYGIYQAGTAPIFSAKSFQESGGALTNDLTDLILESYSGRDIKLTPASGFVKTDSILANPGQSLTLASGTGGSYDLKVNPSGSGIISSTGNGLYITNASQPQLKLAASANIDSGWISFFSDVSPTRKGYISWIRASGAHGALTFDANNLGDSAAGNFHFSNGNVGIATNNASEKLEVLGNIKASGKALLKGGVQDGYTNVLTSATGKDFFYVSVPNTNGIGGHVVYTVFATDGTDVQEISGDVKFAAVAKGTTVTASTADVQAPAVVTGGSTLTAALAANTSTNNVLAIGITATTSLTTTNLLVKWRVETPSTFTVNAIP